MLFIEAILTGNPLIIVVPYGVSMTEMINIIIASLQKSQNFTQLYIDKPYSLDENNIPIYQGQPGIVITTETLDEYVYTKDIIPIYLINWGTRRPAFNRFLTWINPTQPMLLFPDFLPTHNATKLEALFVAENDNKIDAIARSIEIPCIIICDNTTDMHSILKKENIPIYNAHRTGMFVTTRRGVLIEDDITKIKNVPANIPVYIEHLDSSNGFNLLIQNQHEHIYIYIQMGTYEQNQYRLLTQAVSDSNQLYIELVSSSLILSRDIYNNLHIN